MGQKLKTLSFLLKELRVVRRKGKRIVFTNGCYDLLHLGHIRLLRKARCLGDILIVGLNSDVSVRRLKGPHRPVNSERVRAELLSALETVDFVVLFSEETPERIIRKIRPHVLVKGGDWKRARVVGKEFVESCGGRVYLFPVVRGYSTTKLLTDRHETFSKRKSLRHYRSQGTTRKESS